GCQGAGWGAGEAWSGDDAERHAQLAVGLLSAAVERQQRSPVGMGLEGHEAVVDSATDDTRGSEHAEQPAAFSCRKVEWSARKAAGQQVESHGPRHGEASG